MLNNNEMSTKNSDDHERTPRTPYYAKLPFVEVILNYILWIGGVVGSIFMLSYSSMENEQRYLNAGYVEKGWKDWIGRYQDNSDYEWSFWIEHFWPVIIVGFTGHFIVARLADYFCPNQRFKLYFLYSAIFTMQFLGIHGLLFMLGHFAMQYFIAVLTKSVAMCWITGCLLAFSLVNETCVYHVKKFYVDQESRAYFLLFSTAMCNLRYIAFSLEYVWACRASESDTPPTSRTIPPSIMKQDIPGEQGDVRRRTSNMNEKHQAVVHKKVSSSLPVKKSGLPLSFFDLLLYQMYYPLFYGGPVINYNEFVYQMKRPPVVWNSGTIIPFAVGMLRHIFWHLFIELMLHYLYVSAVPSDHYLLQRLPIFDLLGVGIAQVVFFYLKYVVMYGMPSHFATSDNLDIPKGPHCVCSKHRMTDMWRYFDKGLHLWLLRYIYIPCGGSRVNMVWATMNSILPFAFVSFWHGASRINMYWGFLSWFGVYIEGLALKFHKTDQVKEFESNYLTPAWSRRLRAGLSSLFMFLLLLSNLYFLSSVSVGNFYWQRFYYESFLATFLIHLVFYGGCQSSMEFERLGF